MKQHRCNVQGIKQATGGSHARRLWPRSKSNKQNNNQVYQTHLTFSVVVIEANTSLSSRPTSQVCGLRLQDSRFQAPLSYGELQEVCSITSNRHLHDHLAHTYAIPNKTDGHFLETSPNTLNTPKLPGFSIVKLIFLHQSRNNLYHFNSISTAFVWSILLTWHFSLVMLFGWSAVRSPKRFEVSIRISHQGFPYAATGLIGHDERKTPSTNKIQGSATCNVHTHKGQRKWKHTIKPADDTPPNPALFLDDFFLRIQSQRIHTVNTNEINT